MPAMPDLWSAPTQRVHSCVICAGPSRASAASCRCQPAQPTTWLMSLLCAAWSGLYWLQCLLILRCAHLHPSNVTSTCGLLSIIAASSNMFLYAIRPRWVFQASALASGTGNKHARWVQIVKVLHGSDSDIVWLQRDFGIYVANLFDTGQAARVLALPSAGLAYLLSHFCSVKVCTYSVSRLVDCRTSLLSFSCSNQN